MNYMFSMGHNLNGLYVKYENIILIGDFNSEMNEDAMNVFCATHNLKNLAKEPTCFKTADVLILF